MDEHDTRVKKAQKTLLDWLQNKKPDSSVELNQASNTMRKKDYKKKIPHLNLNVFNHVLEIDSAKQIAIVEPSVTMEQLVDACLKFGLIPPVVPEFKGITVGGAVNGAALESSSHLYGQFNDICLSYEVLFGDGRVEEVSKEYEPDLFFAIAGSYGTLGFILKVQLQLKKTTGFVELTCVRKNSPEEALDEIKFQNGLLDPPEMLEAIVYNEKKSVIISARSLHEEKCNNLLDADRLKNEWFYSYIDRKSEKLECWHGKMKIEKYLFRHDLGAFWMAGYALNWRLLVRYFFHKATYFLGLDFMDGWYKSLHTTPKNPGFFFRSLFGGLLGSQKLYKSLHHGSEGWFEKRFVIQDFYVPLSRATEFIHTVLNQYRMTPIWLCPIRTTKTPQIFSPHYQASDELLIDIGVYGLPFNSNGPDAVKKMENLTYRLKGKKMFYGYTYLTPEEFWRIYSHQRYKELRSKVKFELFPDIVEKCLI